MLSYKKKYNFLIKYMYFSKQIGWYVGCIKD